MDKALEIIMVAVILMVASVVIIALLQSQSEEVGGFASSQTNSSDCGLAELRYERNIDKESCSETTAANNIANQNSNCAWTNNPLPSSSGSLSSSPYCN